MNWDGCHSEIIKYSGMGMSEDKVNYAYCMFILSSSDITVKLPINAWTQINAGSLINVGVSWPMF